jgi:phospholipid N-methyltransferase
MTKEEVLQNCTPEIADRLVKLADIEDDNMILEPSAGQGAIIEAILRKHPNANIGAIELMEVNSIILKKKGFTHLCGDFLQQPAIEFYDRIIANPPFSKNQDIDHVLHMYKCLTPGGILVSIMSEHWIKSNNRKEKDFKQWLLDQDYHTDIINRGEFKGSGTMVGCIIVKIRKRL